MTTSTNAVTHEQKMTAVTKNPPQHHPKKESSNDPREPCLEELNLP